MIWLIGNKGMLGTDLEILLRAEGLELAASDKEVDITDPKSLAEFVGDRGIEWIINCSAYTAVDKAEDERDLAFRINAEGVRNIAQVAKSKGARFIHFSTDYVFPGDKEGAYTEEDATGPRSIYGSSKLEGEREIIRLCTDYFIIRIAWLYGLHGNNFVHTMLRLFKERDELRVVGDQFGSPTLTEDVAGLVLAMIKGDSRAFGIYHFTNEGRTTWHEFACEIYSLAKKHGLIDKNITIKAISTSEYPTKAVRPHNSYLSKDRVISAMGIKIRDWREALDNFIIKVKADQAGGEI